MKISKRDWTQLSAYLDGELSQRELTKLEARIEGNPEFQAALEDLRNVKTVLSHTPRLSAPRNFTLQQSLVETSPKPVPTGRYRLAAAVLSFLFIGVVVVDIGSGALKGGMLASQAPRAEEVMLDSAADEMEEPVMIGAEEAVEKELAPDAEMEIMAEAPENLAAEKEGESEGMEDAQPKFAEGEGDQVTGGLEEDDGEGVEELSNQPAQEEGSTPEEERMPPAPEEDQTAVPRQIPWLRIIEIILGLGAVGFGGAAWLKHRKNRKL